ncbi:MAG: hypothetical protein KDA93_26750, partial [Planctomycetaceae bacterium]|nr:hypothetical protein [Planctomycetaceae bacterium]
EWLTIGPNEDMATAASHFDVELTDNVTSNSVGVNHQQHARSSRFSSTSGPVASLVQWIAEHRWIVIGASTWIVFNAAVYWFVFASHSVEDECLQAYSEIWAEYKQLTDEEVSPDRWQAFSETSKSRLTPLIEQLNRSTDAQSPNLRNLLWAGRDCLLPLTSGQEPPVESRRFERAYQQHMSAVMRSTQ